MLSKRDITVRIGPKPTADEGAVEPVESVPIQERIRDIVDVLREPAKKVFFGICIYVVLDTIRQVEIAKANNPTK